ncbi:MAG: hypothetical protein OQK24_15150 [Magnetovibrio sp.]|nr:hypothetical protein [Magnetovibrio sp.]
MDLINEIRKQQVAAGEAAVTERLKKMGLVEEESSISPAGYVPEFSQGVCGDGSAILKDGKPMAIEQIIAALRALSFLVYVKAHKDRHGKDEWYADTQPIAWEQVRKAIGT